MQASSDDYLSPYEVEHLVQTLKEISVEEYGADA